MSSTVQFSLGTSPPRLVNGAQSKTWIWTLLLWPVPRWCKCQVLGESPSFHMPRSHPVTSKWLTCTLVSARHHVSILSGKGAQGCKAQGQQPAADLHPRCTSLHTTTGCHSLGFSTLTGYLAVLDTGAHQDLVDTTRLSGAQRGSSCWSKKTSVIAT